MGHTDAGRHDRRRRAPFCPAALSQRRRGYRRAVEARPRAGAGRASAQLRRLRNHAGWLSQPRSGSQGVDRRSADLACPCLGAAPGLDCRQDQRPDLQRQRQRPALLGALWRQRPGARSPSRLARATGAVVRPDRSAHRHHAAAFHGRRRARCGAAPALARAKRLPAAQGRDLRLALSRSRQCLRMGDADGRPWPALCHTAPDHHDAACSGGHRVDHPAAAARARVAAQHLGQVAADGRPAVAGRGDRARQACPAGARCGTTGLGDPAHRGAAQGRRRQRQRLGRRRRRQGLQGLPGARR